MDIGLTVLTYMKSNELTDRKDLIDELDHHFLDIGRHMMHQEEYLQAKFIFFINKYIDVIPVTRKDQV